jgi:uncharacterized protein YdaU (DUF1376 family)
MSGSLFMPLWTDAYLGDTRHLSTVQHGAYLLILMSMWRNGGDLPNDEKRIARIAGLPMDRWRKISDAVMELFEIEGELITQKRLRLELKKSLGVSEKRATASAAGVRAKALKNKKVGLPNGSSDGSPEDQPKSNQSSTLLNTNTNTNTLNKINPYPTDIPPLENGEAETVVEGIDETDQMDTQPDPVEPAKPAADKRRKPAKVQDELDLGEPGKAKPDPRGSRLPDDWDLGEEELIVARKLGLTYVQAKTEAEKFKDHWHSKAGKDARKVNWLATWRTWCRNAQSWGVKSAGNIRRPAI